MLNKLEKYLFYIFLFSIPFQTRKILYFTGWRFDEWQSISIYATDLLFVILLGFWLYNFLPEFRAGKYNLRKYDYFLIGFILISAISIKNSSSPIVSWFQWLKLVELSVFYYYLSRYALAKFGLYNSFTTLVISGVFQSVIAIIQFLKQSSIGLKYLGESVINSELTGIASFYMPNGDKIIRSYGTFPHPNVLATFILLSLFSFYFVYLYSRLHSEHEPFADNWDKFFLIASCIMMFALFTTFSRVVIFIWFVSFCLRSVVIRARRHYRIVFGTQEGRRRIRAILLTCLFVIVLFGSFYSGEMLNRANISSEDQAVQLRTFYAKEAVSEINWFGVGIGNFVGWLRNKEPFLLQYTYQPAHNIYLLIYSETGILGISAFILFLIFLIKDFIQKTKLKKAYHLSLLVFFGSILFVGIFDHLLWTLQQGRLVFWFPISLLTYLANNDIITK